MSQDDTDIGKRTILRLTEFERQYLKTESVPDDSTYSLAQADDRIQTSVQQIPFRLNSLVEDVEKLNEQLPGIVSWESWMDCWYRIMGLGKNPSPKDVEEGYTISPTEENPYPTSGLADFGEQLGRLAKGFYVPRNGDEIFSGQIQIVLGFVEGLCFEEPESSEFRQGFVDALTKDLKKHSEEMAELDDETWQAKEKRWETIEKTELETREAEEKVKAILEAEEITPAPQARWVIEKLFQDRSDAERIGPGEYLVSGDQSVKEELTRETVLDIVKSEELSEKTKVMNTLQDDFRKLKTIEWRGLASFKMIECIVQSEEDVISVSQINKGLETKKDFTKQIPKLTADFSGREPPWDDRPLLKKRGDRWELTKYGEAIGYSVSERFQFLEGGSHPKTPPEKMLKAASDELCF